MPRALARVAFRWSMRLVVRFGMLAAAAVVATGVAVPSTLVAQDPTQSGVSLKLTYRPGTKTSLLVLPIRGASGDSIATIISRDFDYSDRFTVAPTTSAIDVSGPVNYAVFSKLAVDGIVQGTLLPSGWLRLALHDVTRKQVINTKDFPLPATVGDAGWRFAVHGISDAVEEWITGQRGIAATRIAFEREGRIWTIDSDGAGIRAVTPRGLSPQWAPGGRALVYNVLGGADNPIVVADLATGAQRTLTAARGMNDMTPSVSPDGRTGAVARVSESGTDLFSVPFEGGTPRRITVGRGAISFSPSFSPDGQRIVFASDRSGHNEVYISDADGTNAEPVTTGSFGDRNYRAGPDWSPDGRLIAFASLNGGTFQIMTVNLRDQSVKIVTSDGRNEDPSWAPDARHLVFTSTRSGVRQLWVVDIETGRTRQLRTNSSSRLAAWSPRLSGS